jgi:hypothetical protein
MTRLLCEGVSQREQARILVLRGYSQRSLECRVCCAGENIEAGSRNGWIQKAGKPVAIDFTYDSGINEDWVSVGDLKHLYKIWAFQVLGEEITVPQVPQLLATSRHGVLLRLSFLVLLRVWRTTSA